MDDLCQNSDMSAQRVITGDGVKLAYERHGVKGPVVVFIHGVVHTYVCKHAELISTLTDCSSVQAGAAAGIISTAMQRFGSQNQSLQQHLPVTQRRYMQAVGRTCQVYRYDARFHGDSDKPEWVITSYKGANVMS